MMRAIMGRLALVAIGGLMVSACGSSSTDNVDNSELTELNAAGMMEGTVNDASAMDVPTDTNVAANADVADNAASDAANASDNTTESNKTE